MCIRDSHSLLMKAAGHLRLPHRGKHHLGVPQEAIDGLRIQNALIDARIAVSYTQLPVIPLATGNLLSLPPKVVTVQVSYPLARQARKYLRR